jgi:hypothetical protein
VCELGPVEIGVELGCAVSTLRPLPANVTRIEDANRQAVSIMATAVSALLCDRRLMAQGAPPDAVFEQTYAQPAAR